MSSTVSPFPVIYAFGDSLSDAGDAYLFTTSGIGQAFGARPQPVSPPYYAATYAARTGGTLVAHEFSNGPVWVQQLAASLGIATPGPGALGITTQFGYQPVVAGALNGTDFAIGGSVTGPTAENTGPTVPLTDLSAQITNFERSIPVRAADALYTVWSGSNDLLDLLGDSNFATLYATGIVAQDVTQSVDNEVAAVQRLVADGAGTVLVVNVPDLGIVPAVTAGGAAVASVARSLAASFNAQLMERLAAATFGTARVVVEDVFTLLDDAVQRPAAYGFANVTTPVYAGSTTAFDAPLAAPGPAQDGYLFFDRLHPTAAGHAAIAADALRTLGVTCYVAGTLIETPDGEVPVERVAIGTLVTTASGAARPVRWVGRRSFAGRFLAGHAHLRPVRFRAGSLGHGLPRRDLLVSPEHAMFIGGVLIPARALVNGDTIAPVRGLDRVDYLHLELDGHDVILAEGAASETFLDDDSRGMFHNAGEFHALHPGHVPGGFCAPRMEAGPEVDAVRARLAVRRAA